MSGTGAGSAAGGGAGAEDPRERALKALVEVVGRIAPEVSLDSVDPRADLRREADLDSIDVVNVLLGLEEALDIEIPEADTSRMGTLEESIAYLAGRLADGG